MPVAAIILAAGASLRLGQPKQLLHYQGETLLARAMRLAHEAGASPVFAVLGANAAAISAAVRFAPAIPIANERWQQGMSTSIHAGLRALDADAPQSTGVLLVSCDQPRLTAAHLRALIDAFNAQSVPHIVASRYAGIFGVPAVFPRCAFSALNELRADKGARSVLANPPCPLIAVEFEGGDVDIDLPADLAHLGYPENLSS